MHDIKKLISNSSIIFVGTIISSVFSYLFNMLMGRLLGPAQYGEVAAILSVTTIFTVGSGAVLTVVMRYTSELVAHKEFSALNRMFKIFTRYMLFFGIMLFLICSAFSGLIAKFFVIPHILPLIIIFSSLIYSFVYAVNKGVLQGGQRFVPISVISIVEMGVRLLLGILLVKFGYQVSGATLAIVLGSLIAYFITFWPIEKIIASKVRKKQRESYRFDKKEVLLYLWPTFLTMLFLAITLNLDVILVKHYFSAEEAGLYAAVSTVAKIILYATSPIISVMFPMISERIAKDEKHYKTFFFSLILTSIGSLIILALYVIAPGKIMGILYGKSYVVYYSLLPEVGLAFVFYSLANILINYYLAIKKFFFIWLFLITVIIQITLINYFHNTLIEVVRIFIFTFGLFFVALMINYLYLKKDQLFRLIRNNGEEA